MPTDAKCDSQDEVNADENNDTRRDVLSQKEACAH